MANIPLKTIKFPELSNTYTIPEISSDLVTSGKAADAKKVGDELSKVKADLGAVDVDMTKFPSLDSGEVGEVLANNGGVISHYESVYNPSAWLGLNNTTFTVPEDATHLCLIGRDNTERATEITIVMHTSNGDVTKKLSDGDFVEISALSFSSKARNVYRSSSDRLGVVDRASRCLYYETEGVYPYVTNYESDETISLTDKYPIALAEGTTSVTITAQGTFSQEPLGSLFVRYVPALNWVEPLDKLINAKNLAKDRLLAKSYDFNGYALAYNAGAWLSPQDFPINAKDTWDYLAITVKNPSETAVNLTSLSIEFETDDETVSYGLSELVASDNGYVINATAGGSAVGVNSLPYLKKNNVAYYKSYGVSDGDLQWRKEDKTTLYEGLYLIPIPEGTKKIYMDWVPSTYNIGLNVWEKTTAFKWVDAKDYIPQYDSNKEISMLLIGHSHTQDFISYVPYILKNYFPEVSFKFYMAYVGGATLKTQYTRFQNKTAFSNFYYTENSQSWTKGGTKNIDDILTEYTFDVVCMPTYLTDHQASASQDIEYWDMCVDYIANNYAGDNPLKFIPLFQTTLRDNLSKYPMATQFSNTIDICKYILKNCVADDFIPMGMAVQMCVNNPTMATLGDYGYFSVDGNHTQEGLPGMMQGFMGVAWILEKLGIQKSIYGCKARMTTAIYQTLNIPGPNLGSGVLTGTEEQNLLGQKIALKAIKAGKKFFNEAVSDISYDGIDT